MWRPGGCSWVFEGGVAGLCRGGSLCDCRSSLITALLEDKAGHALQIYTYKCHEHNCMLEQRICALF